MKKLVYLMAVLFLISCAEQELITYNEMRSDKFMSDFFTDNELQDLAKIVDFFESEMLEKFSESKKYNLQETYKKFNIADSIEYRKNFSYLIFLNFKKQKELYKKLDSNLVYKIWVHPRSNKTNKLIKEELFIKCYGEYLNFLKKVGEIDIKYGLFKRYAQGVENQCGISIQNTMDLTLNYRFFNTEDIKTRLLFAVHYLSTNEELIQTQLNK
jgi:hypothetical protein